MQVALDQRLVDSSAKIGIHTNTSAETVFSSGAEIKAYLEKTGVAITVVDFSLVAVQAASKTEAKKPPIKAQTQSAKNEDAELIGITTKKEVDFATWYREVLVKGEMLDYYDISGCYILKVCFCCSRRCDVVALIVVRSRGRTLFGKRCSSFLMLG